MSVDFPKSILWTTHVSGQSIFLNGKNIASTIVVRERVSPMVRMTVDEKIGDSVVDIARLHHHPPTCKANPPL